MRRLHLVDAGLVLAVPAVQVKVVSAIQSSSVVKPVQGRDKMMSSWMDWAGPTCLEGKWLCSTRVAPLEGVPCFPYCLRASDSAEPETEADMCSNVVDILVDSDHLAF